MKYTSHLLDEAISLASTLGINNKKVSCAHIIYGFAKLVTLEPAYANAMFTTEELASLEKVKQVLDYNDYDYQLIKVGMPFMVSGKRDYIDGSGKLLEEILESCKDEEDIIKAIVKANQRELQIFISGNSLSDIINKSKESNADNADNADDADIDITVDVRTADPLDPEEDKEHISGLEIIDKPSADAEKEPDEKEGMFARISSKTNELNKALLSNIIGQNDAILKFVRGYFNSNYAVTGRSQGPRAAFFLTGPAGVGKSYMAAIAAEKLELPHLVLDMREFTIPAGITDFLGTDKAYGGTESRLLKFVRENPSGLVVFENIEECYISILNAVARILQSGKLYNPAKGDYVDFNKATIIITSRLGKSVYDDPTAGNVSAIPQNIIIDSIQNELRDMWNGDLTVDTFCKGLEAKDVIMFGNLRTRHLLSCIDRSAEELAASTEERYGFKCIFDPKLSALLLHSAPSVRDARTAIAAGQRFIKNEFFEIAGLASAHDSIKKIKTVVFEVNEDGVAAEIAPLFKEKSKSNVLVVCKEPMRADLKDNDAVHYIFAEDISDIKKAAKKDILFALIDPYYGSENDNSNLALEDSSTTGLSLLYGLNNMGLNIPVYVTKDEASLNDIDKNYLLRAGAVGVVDISDPVKMRSSIEEIATDEQTDRKCRTLIKRNGYISYKSAQQIDENDASILRVSFYDLMLRTSIDSGDSFSLLRDAERPDTKFDDVIGAENAKSELKYFTSYLRDPKGFMLSGGKPPKGVLLYGPPGTGKTMLARAMAGESNVAFIQTSATQFMDKYAGESERKIRDLFKRAKEYSPAIIFIDEIDAIGKARTGSSNTHYTESMLNALLTEMDGFKVDSESPVFVLAATNYGMSNDPDDPRKLDEALLRRFDNRILVDLPKRDERVRFINIRLNKIKDQKVSAEAIKNMADRTTGQSLAILQNIIDLAFRNAVKNSEILDDRMLMDALEEFNYGEKHEWRDEYYRSTAIHEAGHAVMSYIAGETPSFATIVSRGNFGGYVQKNTDEEKPTQSRSEMIWNIRIALAGRAAEKVFFGEDASINTGASSDLQAATRYALQMICSYGMMAGKMIALPVETILKTPLAQTYLEEANLLIEKEMSEAETIICDNKEMVETLADALMRDNYLTSKQIEGLLGQSV